MRKLLTLLALCTPAHVAMAQTTMNIYQSNGSVLQIPVNTIDSITYTIGTPGQLATLTTLPIGNIGATSATSGGNVTSNGGTPVTQRGVVWSTSPNPTTANSQTNNGSSLGSYTSNLSGLVANTTYYVRAYAVNSAGTAYGNQLSFTTAGGVGIISTLNCNGAANIGTLTSSTAASGVYSNVPYTGGNGGTYTSQSVNSTGVTGLTATLSAGSFASGSGTLTYTITGTPAVSGTASFALSLGGQNCVLNRTVDVLVGSITALSCSNATNVGTLAAGIAASGVSSSIPYSGGNGAGYNAQSVNSSGVTGLTATLAAGSFANGTGSLAYTITGTPNVSGTASFSLSIGGQSCVLTRYVTVVSNPGQGVNFDGHNYSSVVLGNGQEWMAENLRTTTYSNGDPIPHVTDANQWYGLTSGAWVHYNNDSQLENPYGKLYNWYTVSDPRNVCPTGWHVPTDSEWNALQSYLHPNSIGNNNNIAGGKMKSTGTNYWQSPNTDATNESGFSGLPGGYRGDEGPYYSLGGIGFWWSSSEYSSYGAWSRRLVYNNGVLLSLSSMNLEDGLSVRCLRD